MFIAQTAAPETGDNPPVPAVVVPFEAKAREKTAKHVKGAQSIEVSQVNPHYITPDEFAAAGRYTVGGRFQLDVASCAIANLVIQALKWFGPDVGIDGLSKNWGTKKNPKAIWCNPPGGRGKMIDGVWVPSKTGPQSSQRVFFEKFISQWQAGKCWGVFLSFNPDVIVRNFYGLLMTLPHCVPSFRPKFQTWQTCINNASSEELQTTGMPPALAQRIIDHRPYTDLDDLTSCDRTGDGQPVVDELGLKKLKGRLTCLAIGEPGGLFVTDDSPTKGGLVILFPPPPKAGLDVDSVIDRFLCHDHGFSQFNGGDYGCTHDPRPPRSIGDILGTTDNLGIEELLTLQNLLNQTVATRVKHQQQQEQSEEVRAANETRFAQARANGCLQVKWNTVGDKRYGPYWVRRWMEGGKKKVHYYGKQKPGG